MKCFTYGQGILDQVSLFHALLSPGVVIQEACNEIFFFDVASKDHGTSVNLG